jgi:hypothetical protein
VPGQPGERSRHTRRRHPERAALYCVVQQHLETWLARRQEIDRESDPIPSHVERERRSWS